MLKINKPSLQGILLFLIFLFLPTQFGKHFWPTFAYVAGQRVDYLSPTLYFTDILIILLFVASVIKKQLYISRKLAVFLLVALLYMSLGIFLSVSPLNGWYSLAKLLECVFLAWFVAMRAKGITTKLFWSLGLGVVVEGILGILQFVHQSSLNGFWYFLGERTFSASTPGIANATIRGQLILRPYATFPHPNVFAGYLVISLLFFLTAFFAAKNTFQRFFSAGIVVFGSVVLFITLCRVAIITFIFFTFLFLLFKFKKQRLVVLAVFVALLAAIFFSSSSISGRFLDIQGYIQSVTLRDVLITTSLTMFFSHPLFGIGLGNFLPLLPQYLSSKILFGFLQPVHNIFLLVLVETGTVGLISFVWIVVQAFFLAFSRWKKHDILSQFAFLSLAAICLIGMTDHYFFTLQQGQLLFAIVLGLCFRHGTIRLWPFTKNLPQERYIK